MKSIFNDETNNELLERINNLNSSTIPKWGKMSVSQMLNHVTIPYNDILKRNKKKSKFSFIFRFLLKGSLTGDTPYRKNSPTAKRFIIKDEPDFEIVKTDLVEKMTKVHNMGEVFFEGKVHPLIGKLTAKEWSNMLYKHLDHHLKQFGV